MGSDSGALPSNQSRQGIISLLIALFFFSFQDMIIKYMSADYSILQLLFVRSSIALVILMFIACAFMGPKVLIAKQPGLLMIRGILVVICIGSYYLAIPVLPLADIAGIVFSSPMMITILSVIILKEKVKAGCWLAIFIGFSGVLLIIKPSGQFTNAGVLLALGSACTYSVMSIITRQINQGDHPITIAIYSLLIYIFCCLFGLFIINAFGFQTTSHPSLAFLTREWIMPDQFELLLLISLGLVGTVGFYCIARAYQIAPSSHVAPFEYAYIVFVVILAYLFFAEIPQPTTFLGIAVLICSGLYVWYQETHGRKSV